MVTSSWQMATMTESTSPLMWQLQNKGVTDFSSSNRSKQALMNPHGFWKGPHRSRGEIKVELKMSNLASLLMSLYLEMPSCSHLGQDEAGSGRKRCLSLSTSPPLEMFLDKVAVAMLPLMTLRAPDRSQELDKGGCFYVSPPRSWTPGIPR